jgi:ribosomal protein L14E/L6E/L27E
MDHEFSGLAISLKGRDAGEVFLAFGRTDTSVLLVDGRIRKLSKPKRKNLRHVRFLKSFKFEAVRGVLDEQLTDAQVRRVLARYKKGADNVQGGT